MPDDILIRFSVKDDGSPVIERVNEKLGQTKKQSQALVPGLENARKSLTSFVGENAALIGILVGVGAAVNKVIQDHIKYAEQVRTLSTLSGQSTEETSRFIQVLDDYKISADDALLATKALTKNGHVPSIETLAKLSDQYLAITDAEEKNEFVLKNLGKGGIQWVEVLNKGSKALLAQGAAIDKNLILTQKMVDDARKAEIATDNWNDTIGALKTQFAVNLLPTITDALSAMNAWIRAGQILKEQGQKFVTVKEFAEAFKQAREEQEASTEAMLKNAEATEASTKTIEENEKAIEARNKAMTDANQAMLGLIGDIQGAEESYQTEAKKLNAERIKIEDEKAKAIAEGWSLSSDKIKEYDDALAENSDAAKENARAHERANLEIISALVERKLMQDGVLDNKEFEWLIKKRQEWGIYSADVVTKARAAWQEADRIAESINKIPSNKNVSINVNTIYQATGTPGAYGFNANTTHAIGGTFMIPQSYGHEGFHLGGGHTASGGEQVTVTPKNQDVIDYKKLSRAIRDAMRQVA